MKIQVYQSSDLSSYYLQASKWVKDNINQALDFDLTFIPNQEFPLKEYVPNLWGVDFDFIRNLDTGKSRFVMLAHFTLSNSSKVVGGGFALHSSAGTQQLSQVNSANTPLLRAILHELAHSIHFYLGIVDRTHEFLNGSNDDANMPKLYKLLEPYWDELNKEISMIEQFVKKYAGRKVDFDGTLGAQCVDLVRMYLKELGLPQPPSIVSAYLAWNRWLYPKGTGIPQSGDIVVWGQKWGPDGHIAVVVRATASSVKVLEQNNPLGSPCRVWDHSYNNILGWLRPISSLTKGEDMKYLMPINGPEISFVDGSGIRHPLTQKAWVLYHGSSRPTPTTVEEINSYQKGIPHFYSMTFGAADVTETTDFDIWNMEKIEDSEVVE